MINFLANSGDIGIDPGIAVICIILGLILAAVTNKSKGSPK